MGNQAYNNFLALYGEDPLEHCSELATYSRKQIGDIGERYAAHYLVTKGYEILDKNVVTPFGEADIIARESHKTEDGKAWDEHVLIEVKTRVSQTSKREIPELAVNERKCNRYKKIALCYLAEHLDIEAIRFDVIAINLHGKQDLSLRHLIGAFSWDEQ